MNNTPTDNLMLALGPGVHVRAGLVKWGTPASERDAFEAAWEKLYGKRPVLWHHTLAELNMETPAYSEGVCFAAAELAAWKLWQARADLGSAG